ncbi:hypothetical protein ACHAXS_000621 [Conticribra weissflogii]
MSFNFCDYDCCTALYMANCMGLLDVVKFIMAKGTKINCSNCLEGWYPLDNKHCPYYAAVALLLQSQGSRDIKEVKMLLLGHMMVMVMRGAEAGATANVKQGNKIGDYLSISLVDSTTIITYHTHLSNSLLDNTVSHRPQRNQKMGHKP